MNNQIYDTISLALFAFKDSIFSSYFALCPYPWDTKDLLMGKFLENKKPFSENFEGVFFLNKSSIFIEDGVKISKGATIEGPCYLGKNVTIGPGAYIRAGTFLAPNVHIGHCSEVVRSVFFEGAKAPHFNYVGDSIIGKEVNLGASAILANLRLDEKNVDLYFQNQKISTGKRKFGSLIGDGASIGCGAILNPGTIVSKMVKIAPLTTQKGYIS